MASLSETEQTDIKVGS